MANSIMKNDEQSNKFWYLNGVKVPWLKEALKTKAHLDKIFTSR